MSDQTIALALALPELTMLAELTEKAAAAGKDARTLANLYDKVQAALKVAKAAEAANGDGPRK